MDSILLSTVSGIGNDILTWLQDKANYLVHFLPGSPFRRAIDLIGNVPYMNYINWFVPVNEMVLILMWWTTAIGIYYCYVIILRWVKAIE